MYLLYWETDEEWNYTEYRVVYSYRTKDYRLPRKTKKKMKKIVSYLIEKVK